MPDKWPFDDPGNVAVFTLKRLVQGGSPILRVTHDEEDGGWQFLDGGEVSMDEALLVCLRNMIHLDPSLFELADLPIGWVAERDAPGKPWRRKPSVTEDDRERKVVSDIEEFGWHVALIMEDDDGPSFAYSIGLFQNFGHPEMIIIGLDVDVLHGMINIIGAEVRQGRRYADGDSASGVLEGFVVRFQVVARGHYHEHLGYARWFYKGDDFPVLQCLWPDRQGRFPADPGFPDSLRPRQPSLAPPIEGG
jgi:hypothetical protein